jgi:hypothetical protein
LFCVAPCIALLLLIVPCHLALFLLAVGRCLALLLSIVVGLPHLTLLLFVMVHCPHLVPLLLAVVRHSSPCVAASRIHLTLPCVDATCYGLLFFTLHCYCLLK